jgi:hypothetical protein
LLRRQRRSALTWLPASTGPRSSGS